MAIDWKGLFTFAANTPIGRHIIGATLGELEANPKYIKFVEHYQGMQAKASAGGAIARAECMICLFHKYGVDNALAQRPAPPQHRCADRNGALFP